MLTFKTMPQEVFAQELKIGVVDINKIFDKFEKRKDLDQQLKDMEVEYKDEIESKKKAMIDLSEETQLLDLGSEKRNKNMETLERKNVELEGYAKLAEKQLTKRYKDAFEKIYEEITKEVDAFGKENNYSLIIKKEDSDLQTNQISDLQFKIGIRTVLYNSNRVDVTANITDRLNARYKKGKE
jgi:Skp family chaperone for outer membrane proteins